MATLITIAVGSSIGLVCRRFAAAHPFGAFTDVLLGITGAFAARWFVDVLRQIGVDFESYSWMFVLCGAALPPLGFHGFYRQARMGRQWVCWGDLRTEYIPSRQLRSKPGTR